MSIDLGNDRLSIGNQLLRAAWRHPDKEAVACKGKRRTFKELNDRVNSLAHGLMEMGIKKGDFVSILMLNSIEYVEAYFALGKMGAIAAPLNYRLTPGDIEKLINQCEPVAIIFSSEFKDLVEGMRPNIKSVKHYIFVGEEKVENTIAYEKLATGYSTAEPDVEIFRDDGQCINYTSGTTGLPKASIMTHYNNLMQITQIFMEFSPDSKWVFMTVFPMFHRVGFITTLLAMTVGGKNVITELNPQEILESIEKEKVNVFAFVPVMINLLMMVPDFEKYDTSSLKLIIYAGSPLTTEVREATYKYFVKDVAEGYGITESSLLVWCDPETKRKKPMSLGTPMYGVELRIVDEEDVDVPIGEIGEIICRSPAMNANYFKNPERTAKAIRGGWFHTDDLGRFDEDKHLYVVGRVEDMIISGTDRIFAPEIEDLFRQHPKIMDAAVIGLPDKALGKMVAAVLTVQPEEQIDENEILGYLKGKIADFKIPKNVIITDAIPRTPTGKILKYQLVEKYSE